MNQIKIIFIPGDNIDLKISRSYIIAEGLAKYCEVYWIHWYDTRNRDWAGEKNTILNSFKCLFKSFFRFRKIKQTENKNFFKVEQPFLNQYLIKKLLGDKISRILMRSFNTYFIEKLIYHINPDYVFYFDGFFYTNITKNGIKYFTDIQDDFDENLNSKKLLNYEILRGRRYFNNAIKNYVISDAVQKHFTKLFKANFEILENGAYFELIRNVSEEDIQSLKIKHNLDPNTLILSYIGSEVWFDILFAKKLVEKLNKLNIDFRLFLIGNLPKLELKNVINEGVLNPKETYSYYNLSDIGLLLKSSINSDFLYNSVPLKIIQYAAAKKPVICFPIKWVQKENFKNVFICNDVVEEWIDKILELRNFKWSDIMEKQWIKYNWEDIIKRIVTDINKIGQRNVY